MTMLGITCRLMLSLLLAVPFTASPQAPAEQRLATFATEIERLVVAQAEAEVFSGIVLVARGNDIVFQRAYGFADWELRVPNGAATRFGIASITKPMTEVLVGALARAGRIDIDAPVEQYLSGFPRGPGGGVPTIRHLLTHQSGVPHRVTEPIDETQTLDAADIVERVRVAGLSFEPGSDRLYSSAGYTCLARVIEIVERKPFAAVLSERVFSPAGMTSAISETGQGLMPRRAAPYRLGSDGRQVVVKRAPYKDLRFLTGAGSVYATAEDLLMFVQAVRAGSFGQDVAEEAFAGDPEAWYGWAGRTNGYEGWVDVLPADELTLVFLSNLQSAANWQLREQIHNVLDGQPTVAVPLPPAVAPPFEEAEVLLGSYGPAEITRIGPELVRGDNEFYPINGARYYIPASGTMMRFRRDSTGAVDAIISIGGGGRESILPRSGDR